MTSGRPPNNSERGEKSKAALPCHETTGSGSQPSETAEEASPDVIRLPQKVAEELESFGLDPSDPDNIQMMVKASFSSGLLPPARDLKEYSDASPEAVPKILEWADAFQRHRRESEERDFQLDSDLRRTSQRNALVVALFGLSVSAVLGWLGATTVAVVTAIVAVGGPPVCSIIAQVLSKVRLGRD